LAQPLVFVRDIKPIFETKCLDCHRSEKVKGGLLMDTRANVLKGGDSGTAMVVGDPGKSLLIQRVHLPAEDDERMPPKGDPLSSEQTQLLARWVAEGAEWPENVVLRYRSPEEQQQLARSTSKQSQLREIKVMPDQITLETKRDTQNVIVTAVYQDDVTLDVTSFATIQAANPALVSITNGLITPLADGSTELVVSFGGQEVKKPIEVKRVVEDRPISFNLDVMPVFMRGGCNTGGCHGSSRGKDGFHLSLFGFDPAGDYHRITREMNGRRINLALPGQSLLVEKSIERVPHTGGKLFEENSHLNQTLVEWISNGAPQDVPEVAKVTGIEVFPKQIVLEGTNSMQQLIVRATYSDGTDRDVTNLAVFVTNNETSVKIDKNGLASSGSRGEAFLLARFDNFSVGTQAIVIPENLVYTKPTPVVNNYIDELVHDKLHKLRMLPTGLCTDETFLRRVHADIVGVLPTEQEYRDFVADQTPDKRRILIDKLLARKEFSELWVMKWAELLQIRSNIAGGNRNYKRALLYYNWLQERISKNVPMNQVVKELLSASGGTFSNPGTNFYEMEQDKLKLTENVAQVFMGMRIQCAQCHNHPFDRWTMDDYYGFAAFFSQVGRKQSDDPREIVIFNSGGGETPHLVTKQPIPPKFLGGEVAPLAPGQDRRESVAEWLSSPDNPYFSRNLANMIWAHFFGVGIIEPVDDVRISNPASNPELLDALSAKLKEYNYDFKKLVADICNSATYQRSSETNETNVADTRNFSHSQVRRMRAEVALDAISQVTETPNKFKGLPLGARATQISDGTFTDYFLTTFGRATRDTVCSCEVKMEPNLSQALHMLNGDATGARISRGKVIEKLKAEGKNEDQIIESLFVRSFSRRPNSEELVAINEQLKAVPEGEKAQAIEDVFWAILNAKEFMFLH
jgi:hypothetical protein